MAEESRVSLKRSDKGTFWQRASREYIRYLPLFVFAILVVVLGLTVPHFLTLRNIINILQQSSALGLMTIDMTLVFIT